MLKVAVKGNGSFEVVPEQVQDPERCGILEPAFIAFRVHVEGNVDEKGFVIDVREIPAYFYALYQERREVVRSCETIAIMACEHFKRRVRECSRVYVEVEANTNRIGFASAEWMEDRP